MNGAPLIAPDLRDVVRNGDENRAEFKQRALIERLEKVTLDLATAKETILDQQRTIGALKAEKAKRDGAGRNAPLIREWLEYWLAELGPTRGRKPDIEPGSDRWARTARALGRRIMLAKARGAENPDQEALADLKAVVDAVKRDAWRQGANDRGKRYVDVKHILKDEQVIEAFIAEARGEHETFANVVELPGAENRALKDLRRRYDAQREVLDELHQQLATKTLLVQILGDAVRSSGAHNGWPELQLLSLKGEDTTDLFKVLTEHYGDELFAVEDAYRRHQ